MRDTYFCGVKYGLYDMDQLLGQLQRVDLGDGSCQLMISPGGVYALEQFFLAKYFLTGQVYFHKVRLITDQMILRAIRLGIDVDGIKELRTLFAYDGSSQFVQNYARFDDSTFLHLFTDDRFKGKYVFDLLMRLQHRRLLKRVFQKRLSELPIELRDELSNIADPANQSARDRLEQAISDRIAKGCWRNSRYNADPKLVIVHAYTVKSARANFRDDEENILVAHPGLPRPFVEESNLFNSIEEKSNEWLVEVYAPISYQNKLERKEVQARLEGPIIEAIADSLGKGGQYANP